MGNSTIESLTLHLFQSLYGHNQSTVIGIHAGYSGSIDDHDLFELGYFLDGFLHELGTLRTVTVCNCKNTILTILCYLKHILHHLV